MVAIDVDSYLLVTFPCVAYNQYFKHVCNTLLHSFDNNYKYAV